MASIYSPHKGTVQFITPGQTFSIVIKGATDTNASAYTVRITNDLGANWPCTIQGAAVHAQGVQLTVTSPATVSREVQDLEVVHASYGTLRAAMSLSVVDSHAPTNFLICQVPDIHYRYDTVQTNDPKYERTWYRYAGSIQRTGQALNILRPRLVLWTGDQTHQYNTDTALDTTKDRITGFNDLIAGMRVASGMTLGNHDVPKGAPRNGEWMQKWLTNYGPGYGVIYPADKCRIILHDYGDPDSLTWAKNELNRSFAGSTIVATHYDTDQWWYCLDPSLPGFDLYILGHLHRMEKRGGDSKVLMSGPAYYNGQSVFFTMTRGASKYTYQDTSTWGSSQLKKLFGDYGEQLITSTYTKPNNNAATDNTVRINNKIGVGNADSQVRFVLAKGSYNITGGTVIDQYDIGSDTTVVVASVNIPATGEVAVSATPSTVIVSPGPITDPKPADNSPRKFERFVYYGFPDKDGNGNTLTAQFFADETGVFIVRSRNREYQITDLNNAGYTGPHYLYQRGIEFITDPAKLSNWSSQWYDNSAALQSLLAAVRDDSNCYLYGDSAYTNKLTAISGDGWYFDPAHPKVRAFINAAALKHLQDEPRLNGYFFDNVGVYENAKKSTGKVYSKYKNKQYTSAEMAGYEQELYAGMRAHLQANLGRPFKMGGNILFSDLVRDTRLWSFDYYMDEALCGYVNSGTYDSKNRMKDKVTRMLEFLAADPQHFLTLAVQAPTANSLDVHAYGMGVALLVTPVARKTPDGIPTVTYKFTNYSTYNSQFWVTNNDFTEIGDPVGDPVFSADGNTATRQFTTGTVKVDFVNHTSNITVTAPIPQPEDPGNEPLPEDPTTVDIQNFTATMVQIDPANPNGRVAGTAVRLDAYPRSVVLVRADLPSQLPITERVILQVNITDGSTIAPHAIAVAPFDPLTVTWNTAPAPRSLSYQTHQGAITTGSAVELDVTEAVRRCTTTAICFVLISDKDDGITFDPNATLVWQ